MSKKILIIGATGSVGSALSGLLNKMELMLTWWQRIKMKFPNYQINIASVSHIDKRTGL